MDNNNMKNMSSCDEASSSQDVVSKVRKQLGEKLVFSPPPNLDPLQIDHIVQKILYFLNVKDLKFVRLVCKLWALEGGERILKKSHLSPAFINESDETTEDEFLNFLFHLSPAFINESDETTEEEFLSFLSLAKPAAMFKLFSRSNDILSILGKFPELAERVKELKYKTDTQYDIRNLAKAIEKFSHLEILETDDLSLQEFQIVVGDEWAPEIVWLTTVNSFLEKLASLKDIRLDLPLNLNYESLMEMGNKLNVSKIVLDKPDIQTVNSLIADELEWPLNHVSWKFEKYAQQINGDSVLQFFIKYSDTLKHLNIEMLINFKNAPNLTKQKPWEDDWLIPVDFPVLETLIISGSDENIWPLLTIALRLPRLKKLVLSRVPQFIDKMIYTWESHLFANGKKLRSLSIEEVELNWPIKYSSYVVLNGSLWPNMKYLKVNLNNASSFLASHLFACWEGLERLDLNFRFIKSSEFGLCQEWLMGGVKYPWKYEKKSVVVKRSDIFPPSKLVDLQNLKSLTLHLPRKSFLLGDFLVYNCLQFMTHLQSLHFHGPTSISGEALVELKESLGKIVSFIDQD